MAYLDAIYCDFIDLLLHILKHSATKQWNLLERERHSASLYHPIPTPLQLNNSREYVCNQMHMKNTTICHSSILVSFPTPVLEA